MILVFPLLICEIQIIKQQMNKQQTNKLIDKDNRTMVT